MDLKTIDCKKYDGLQTDFQPAQETEKVNTVKKQIY